MKYLSTKNYRLYLLCIVSMLFSTCCAWQKPNKLAIAGYNGSAHHAFKVAESVLSAYTSNKKLSLSDIENNLQKPFLHSVRVQDGVALDGQVYALTCGDICADAIWLNADDNKREKLKNIASRVVYIECIMPDCACVSTHESELKKFVHQCALLEKEKNHCCAFVVRAYLRNKSVLTVFVAEKKNGVVRLNIVDDCDAAIVEMVFDMINDKNSLKKIIVNSLNKQYSTVLTHDYVAWLGLNNRGYDKPSWRIQARDAFRAVKNAGLSAVSTVQALCMLA